MWKQFHTNDQNKNYVYSCNNKMLKLRYSATEEKFDVVKQWIALKNMKIRLILYSNCLFIGMPNIAKLPNKSVIIENSLRKLVDIDRKTIQSFVIHVEHRVY